MKSIPLYYSTGAFEDSISEERALRLESLGMAKLIRHEGHINRAIFFQRADDPQLAAAHHFKADAYSFRQQLDTGHRLWKLRPLQGGKSESTLAPDDLRSTFCSVIRERIKT